jgi:peroxiredoxin Q/BCP
LYFYPKDETPGCTTEACTLRDKFEKIRALNTVIYGVSRQDQKSHQEFKAKHKLPFDLLVDTDGAIGKAFGVGTIMGMGLSKRQSFLIGPDGKILKAYTDVDPARHATEIITDIEAAGVRK